MKALWPHQLKAHDLLRDGFRRGFRRGILVAPCGMGKTVTGLEMIRLAVAKGLRGLFVCDRRSLVAQAAREGREYGLRCGVVMADDYTGMYDPAAPVQFASKDTLRSRMDRGRSALPPAALILVDECHRSSGQTYRDLLAAYPDAYEVGLTATPATGDGNRGLGDDRYEFIAQPVAYSELIAAGVLVPARCYAPGTKVQQGAARRPTRADLVGDPVNWWLRLAKGRRTFAFAAGVRPSIALRDAFRQRGVPAEHIDADTPDDERDAVLGRAGSLARGDTLVVTSCSVLKYGVDVPSVECVVLAAPFGSLVDYLQACGRGLRSAPGKADLVVIDHAGSVLHHGFPDADRAWVLDAGQDVGAEYRERMKRGEAPQPVACPRCGFLFSSRPDCPECGWKIPPKAGQKLGHRHGQLWEVQRDSEYAPDLTDLNRAWVRLVFQMAHGGRNLGVAANAFRERFGRTPWDAGVKPLPGNPAAWKRPAAEFVAEVYPGHGPAA